MSQHHDPVHPDSDHLTAELIADLDEGLLDAASTDHAAAHLLECADCRDIRAALAEVTSGLAGLPDLTMPVDVERRLLDALAAATPPPAPAATVVPLAPAPSHGRHAWAGRGFGVAASVALVLLVGAVLVPYLMDSGSGQSTGTASGADAAQLGGTTQAPESINFVASQTGTQYKSQDLDQQVNNLVTNAALTATPTADAMASDSPAPTANSTATSTPSPTGALKVALHAALATDPAAAQACLEQYLGVVGVQPIAIDVGTFQSDATGGAKPAAIIVLPNDSDPSKADVWVVDPSCAGPDAVLLYYAKVSLPSQ